MSQHRHPLSMNATEKRRFIRQLTRAVSKDLCAKVGKMPREWDGMELRELIAEAFTANTYLSSTRNADRKRLREYRNECINRCLP